MNSDWASGVTSSSLPQIINVGMFISFKVEQVSDRIGESIHSTQSDKTSHR